MAYDTSYGTSNYIKHGGKEWWLGSDGSLNVYTGGKITNNGTQASAITNITNNSSGSGASGGTLTAFATAAAGTLTAAQVGIINDNFTVLTAQLAAINAAIKGVGITA